MKYRKHNWLDAFRAMMENQNECFMRFGNGCIYKITHNKLYVWVPGNKGWNLSQECVHNFSQCEWEQVDDPSQEWVKCNHNDLWKWVVKQLSKNNLEAEFRSLTTEGRINTRWTVRSVLENCAGPMNVIPYSIEDWEYLDK